MHLKLPSSIFVLLLACVCVAAEQSRMLVEKTGYENRTLSEVISLAAHYDPGAIIELGKRKDKSAVGLLKKIAAEPDLPEPPVKAHSTREERDIAGHIEWRNLSHAKAKIALARMGEGNYFDEYVAGLSSSNITKVAYCINQLGEIGDKRAVKLLIPLLDDERVPPHHNDRPGMELSTLASFALIKILPDVFAKSIGDSQGKGIRLVQTWKDWWKLNKADYERL